MNRIHWMHWNVCRLAAVHFDWCLLASCNSFIHSFTYSYFLPFFSFFFLRSFSRFSIMVVSNHQYKFMMGMGMTNFCFYFNFLSLTDHYHSLNVWLTVKIQSRSSSSLSFCLTRQKPLHSHTNHNSPDYIWLGYIDRWHGCSSVYPVRWPSHR